MVVNPDMSKSPIYANGQGARSYMAAAPVGAAKKRHPGKAIMAGKDSYST